MDNSCKSDPKKFRYNSTALTERNSESEIAKVTFEASDVPHQSVCKNCFLIPNVLADLQALKEEILLNREQNGKLLEQVINIKNEVRQMKKASIGFVGEENISQNLPINSKVEIDKFDKELKSNPDKLSELNRFIMKIGGDELSTFVRSAFKRIMTDELAMSYSWKGTNSKLTIQNFVFIQSLRDVCHHRFNSAEDIKINHVIQQHLVHAKDRVDKRLKKSYK